MKPERSIFCEHGPAGLPIRARLTEDADVCAVEFWESDFDQYAKAVLESVRTSGKCTPNQANVLALECMTAACRRQKAAAKLPKKG
jgi:hypothetical protein